VNRKKRLARVIGAAAIAMLGMFAVTHNGPSPTTNGISADSGQETKFPSPTPPAPARLSAGVTTTTPAATGQ